MLFSRLAAGFVVVNGKSHLTAATRRNIMSSNKIVRLGTEDPRMSKIVIHQGTVYISGQTDTSSGDDSK
jgi:enamine deaminase RidA (YjgF/YER057c/UK114 family)